MSKAPENHVYIDDGRGRCDDCGHDLVASWHYVTGADLAAARAALTEMDDLARQNAQSAQDALADLAALRRRHAQLAPHLDYLCAMYAAGAPRPTGGQQVQPPAEAIGQPTLRRLVKPIVEAWLASEAARLREAESDEAWMRRVYPQHCWSPDDGITYAQFCRLSRAKWEAEHTELRERYAAAVEAAFRKGYRHWPDHGMAEDAAWLASEARKGLT